jgi:succinyl-CoA synthetase alpha subunit
VVTKIVTKKNEYRDSVFLMVVNERARSLPGIEEIAVMMGTDNNKDIMRDVGFSGSEIDYATANDMLICIRGQSGEMFETALAQIEEMLTKKPPREELEDVYKTLESAVRERPGTNFAVISVPGQFAAREAQKALNKGLNVLLFSDNVSLEEEIELKKLASRLDRIVMGPDCGTAIINHVPLAFANVVNPGPIGIVAAAGTGLQEVVCLIDREGEGISQAIGTGGRDLSDEVGGLSMLKGIEILEEDEETEVIVLISKPPGPSTMKRVLDRVSQSRKKMIVNFLRGDPELVARSGAIAAQTLEEAALLAVDTMRGELYQHKNFSIPEMDLKKMLKEETERMNPKQRFVRGLYSGGTLCDEAMLIMSDSVGEVYSNIPLKPELRLADLSKGREHACIDLGDDYFTKGKPHPMISPETRNRYIVSEAEDPEVAVLLLDIVLGFGAHMDMAGALKGSIEAAKSTAEKRGGHLSVVASVCGTVKDPQNFASQAKKLEEAGVVVMPSNAQAARFATMISSKNSDRI